MRVEARWRQRLGKDGVGTGWRWNGSSMRTAGRDGMETGPGSGIRTGWGQMDGSGDGMAMGTGMGMRIGCRWDGVSWTWGQGLGHSAGPGQRRQPCSRAGLQGLHSTVHKQGQSGVHMVPKDMLGLGGKSVSAWQWVLTPAAVSCGISIEAGLALSTVGPCRVVEAAQALPCAPVARLRVCHIDVIVALAGQAAPTLQRIPIVPRGTLITAGTC